MKYKLYNSNSPRLDNLIPVPRVARSVFQVCTHYVNIDKCISETNLV